MGGPFAVLTLFTILTLTLSSKVPVLNSGYSNVLHQGLSPRQQLGGATVGHVPTSKPDNDEEITTEPQSEQISLLPCQQRLELEEKEADDSDKTTSEEESSKEIVISEPDSEQVALFPRPQRLELAENDDPNRQKSDIDSIQQADMEKRGIYYIYHPNRSLQKVVYATRDDDENKDYFAELKYKNVEPIVEPVYTYDPRSFVLQRLQLIN